jgi:hypothetical protein
LNSYQLVLVLGCWSAGADLRISLGICNPMLMVSKCWCITQHRNPPLTEHKNDLKCTLLRKRKKKFTWFEIIQLLLAEMFTCWLLKYPPNWNIRLLHVEISKYLDC